MRSLKFFSVTGLTALLVTASVISCNKDIELTEQLAPLTPSATDSNAGSWKMIVMTSPSQVAVAAPLPVTDPSYVAELTAIKDAQSKLTEGQRAVIKFWSAGGVLRWNQKLRELVARYNLPPAPKADNSYPVPDSENPFADPNFPFSNPPYAARAYSYVSVAQYEAMKATWYYKFLLTHSRPAPYQVDNGVQSLMPNTGLPSSYPSEDAVLSGVSADMLKNMFPAALEEITLFAADERNAALWSGRASTTDISAGLALGKAIASLMITRAANDGMKNAVGNKATWDAYVKSATDRNEIAWQSQDGPPRPPMLMNFNKVLGWNMTPAQVVSDRPEAPPSTSSEEMKQQTEEVKYYSDHITRERIAIVHKWADGVNTYTPPGHWNDIAEEYIAEAKWSEVRNARAFALINMAMHDAAVACWDAKFFYFNPRPSQMDHSVKTVTGLPNFPAYTSGHSTFSSAAATVLGYLFPAHADYYDAQASEASVSRLYGGIHYRVDIETGLAHGKVIGAHTVTYALSDGGD